MFLVRFEVGNQKKSIRSNSQPVVISNGSITHVWVNGGTRCVESPKGSYKGYESALDYSRKIKRG